MVGKSAVKRVGLPLIPGLAIAINAVGNERDTRALADRAIALLRGLRRRVLRAELGDGVLLRLLDAARRRGAAATS